MSAQSRKISTIGFVSAALALVLGVPANTAFAVGCLTAPSFPAPSNGHWYFRTDRTQDRKCWHLQTDNDHSEQGLLKSSREARVKTSQSAGGFYAGPEFDDFAAQHRSAQLSDEEVEKLYADFLKWKRRTRN
jgi:hypothetical protein